MNRSGHNGRPGYAATANDHTLPHSLEAERALLGSVLLDNAALDIALGEGGIAPEDLYSEGHRIILQRMIDLAEGHRAIDLVTLSDVLADERLLEKAGGAGYLAALTDGVPIGTTAGVGEYCRIIREKSVLRRILNVGQNLQARVLAGVDEPGSLLETAQRDLMEIEERVLPGQLEKNQQSFTLVTLSDLRALPQEAGEYLVEGFLRRGQLCGIFAKPYVGKTTLAMNLAVAVAEGQPFLGRATKQGRVAYLALEGYASAIERQATDLGLRNEANLKFHIGRAPAAALRALNRLIKEHKPTLVFIDVAGKFVRIKEDNYFEVTRELDNLLQLARDSGCLVSFLHHAPKMLSEDSIDMGLGTIAWTCNPDTRIIIRRLPGYHTLELLQKAGNGQEIPQTVLELDPETGRVSLGPSRGDADVSRIKKAILASVSGAKDAQTEDKVIDPVEGKTGVKRKALRELLDEGKLNRGGAGKKGDPYKYTAAAAVPVAQLAEGEL